MVCIAGVYHKLYQVCVDDKPVSPSSRHRLCSSIHLTADSKIFPHQIAILKNWGKCLSLLNWEGKACILILVTIGSTIVHGVDLAQSRLIWRVSELAQGRYLVVISIPNSLIHDRASSSRVRPYIQPLLSSVDPAHADTPLVAYAGVIFALLAFVVVVRNRQMTQIPVLKVGNIR